jgi:hypothetical protein
LGKGMLDRNVEEDVLFEEAGATLPQDAAHEPIVGGAPSEAVDWHPRHLTHAGPLDGP